MIMVISAYSDGYTGGRGNFDNDGGGNGMVVPVLMVMVTTLVMPIAVLVVVVVVKEKIVVVMVIWCYRLSVVTVDYDASSNCEASAGDDRHDAANGKVVLVRCLDNQQQK